MDNSAWIVTAKDEGLVWLTFRRVPSRAAASWFFL